MAGPHVSGPVYLESGDLSEVDRMRVIDDIREILWPKGREATNEHNADTLSAIVQVLADYQLVPREAR